MESEDKKSYLEYITQMCKEKNINPKELMMAGPMASVFFIKKERKVQLLVKEYAELSKKLAEHYQRVLEKLDDDESLLRYIEKFSLLEEALEMHISLGALNTRAIQTIRARKSLSDVNVNVNVNDKNRMKSEQEIRENYLKVLKSYNENQKSGFCNHDSSSRQQ